MYAGSGTLLGAGGPITTLDIQTIEDSVTSICRELAYSNSEQRNKHRPNYKNL